MASTRPRSRYQKSKPKQNTRLYIILAVIILVVVGGFWLFSGDNSPVATGVLPAEITVDQAYEKYEAGVFFLDVRSQEEWDEFHVPNTTLIPLDELPARVGELPQEQEIVVVCRSGNRSQQGRDILLDAGFTQVSSMAGGLQEWRAANFPIE